MALQDAIINQTAPTPPAASAEGGQVRPISDEVPPPAASVEEGQVKKAPAPPKLPDEIMSIEPIQAIFAGRPPAVSVELQRFAKMPEAKVIFKNKELLLEAGLGAYRALSGNLGVFFNQLRIKPAEIEQADREGRLLKIAPPWETVREIIRKANPRERYELLNPLPYPGEPGGPPLPTETGGQGPAPSPASAPPTAPPTPAPAPSTAAPPPTAVPRAPAKLQLARQQAGQAVTAGPTKGPRPGSGRLLNLLLAQT